MKKLKLLPLMFLLILCGCLLAGCGKQEQEGESSPGAAAAATAADDGEMVYAAHFRTIPMEEDQYPSYLAYTPEGFYAGIYEMIEEGEIPEGEVPEYEGQFDTYGQRLYFIDLKGRRKPLEYVSGQSQEDPEGRQDYYSSGGLEKIFLTGDGELIALEYFYESWWDGPKGMSESNPDYWNYSRYTDSYRLLRLDGEGRVLSSAELDWIPDEHEEDWLNFYDAVMDGQGRLVVCGQNSVYVFSADGAVAATVPVDGWAQNVLALRDGQPAVISSGMGGPALAVLDIDRNSVSETYKLDDWPERCFTGSGEYDFYYTSGTRLYGYKLADKSASELLNLLDCDLGANELVWLQAGAEGAFLCYCRTDEELSQAELSLVPRSSLAEKRVLTLGTLGGSSIQEQVLRFNRRHDDVRIQIIDYSETFSEGESDMDGITRLSTEIMTGGMPDLLELSVMPFQQLAAKGLLEDLYPWIDADPELDRSDFLPNVLRAMEQKGKLYQICSGFELYTVLGASSVVGDEPGWSFEELNQALAKMPEGCSVLGPYCSRDQILELCVYADLDSYVDWEKGTCDFENDDFAALLSFCAGFPAEPDYDADYGSDYALVARGEQMLLEQYVYDLMDLGYADQYFGGQATYIGFPVRSGSGSMLLLNDSICMSASCADKEAAWAFLREILLPDYQRMQYNLPVRQDVFQEQMEDAMYIEYETNENGQYLLDENGQRIPIARGGRGYADEGGGSFTLEFYGVTEEQAQRFMHMLEMTDRAPSVYTTVYSLIRNEAEVYFAGQRSAEETARIIQSKVTLYLSEQS